VELAASLEVSPAALAIKFCDTRPFTTSTLIGATTLEQLAHDMDAFDLPWTPEMERGVNDLHAAHSNPCP
jgi:aryl-alcohol dehydrogenase-like predicted oxidoreductase